MVAAQPCGGNEAINQSSKQAIKKEQHQRDASLSLSLSLSVCRFFQRREVAVVAARFSPAPSGMIVGISAGAHEIERHDRSMRY